jgi:hypothetical protein
MLNELRLYDPKKLDGNGIPMELWAEHIKVGLTFRGISVPEDRYQLPVSSVQDIKPIVHPAVEKINNIYKMYEEIYSYNMEVLISARKILIHYPKVDIYKYGITIEKTLEIIERRLVNLKKSN